MNDFRTRVVKNFSNLESELVESEDVTSFSNTIRAHYSLCLETFPEHGRNFLEHVAKMKVDKFKDISGEWREDYMNPRDKYLGASRLFDGLLYLATDFCFVMGESEEDFKIEDYEVLRKEFMSKYRN